jgi:hypothetical protein
MFIKKPESNFPEQYQKIAAILFDEFESTKWGAPTSPSPPPRPLTSRVASHDQTPTLGGVRVFKSEADDPIWGDGGIMHHIIKKRKLSTTTSGRISYKLADGFVSKLAKVYGHNGIAVGSCWPMQLAALRDGAHGSSQGGIHPGPRGAYSILVSNGYEDDKDTGDEIWYSDPSANRSSSETVNGNNAGQRALMASITSQEPVRVIRNDRNTWQGAPKKGYRYDGLYLVSSYIEKARKKSEGNFFIFKLVRMEDQAPIDRSLPTRALARLFEQVGDEF